VAWAEVLREAAVRTLTQTLAGIDEKFANPEFVASLTEARRESAARFRENMTFVLEQSEAKFYIENRANSYGFEALTTANARERLTSYRGNQQIAKGARV
jgi:uncharacterized phage-like protein YoqJ